MDQDDMMETIFGCILFCASVSMAISCVGELEKMILALWELLLQSRNLG